MLQEPEIRGYLDEAQPVRRGETLDLEALGTYLKQALPDPLPDPLSVSQFPSGYSNLTYLLRAGDQEFVLRRPPFGTNVKSAHDMGREFRILSGLVRVYPKVPRPVLFCEDETILGTPFYLMERVKGIILRRQTPPGLDLTPAFMRRLSESFVDNLVEIHALNVAAAGLADLGKPDGYVQRQVEGWTRRYFNAKTNEVPDVERAAQWLSQHTPSEAGAVLVHNDYKYDNFVLASDTFEIKAVLDWEMATLGDPLMDLGTALGYWVDSDDPPQLQRWRFCPTTLPGNLSRTQLVQRYAAASGLDLSDVLFYYVFGLFKISVIIQQIYKRYTLGHAKDPRFADLIEGVGALGNVAALAIEKKCIDRLG